MGSIPAVFALLCVCLPLLASPTSGTLTKLVKLTRETLTNTDQTRLTAYFEADSKPDAIWFLYQPPFQRLEDEGSCLTYGSNMATASVTINNKMRRYFGYGNVCLILGDLQSHYVWLMWDLDQDGDFSYLLDLDMARVTPAADFAYDPGQAVGVTIAMKEDQSRHFYIEGEYFAKNGTFIKVEDYNNVDHASQNGIETFAIVAPTKSETINGIFSVSISSNVERVFQYLGEYIIVKVHEEPTRGPFPDGSVHCEIAHFVCSDDGDDRRCDVVCTAYGNDLETVHMYREDNSGKRELQTVTQIQHFQTFKRSVGFSVHQDTTYYPLVVCRAVLTDGSAHECSAQL